MLRILQEWRKIYRRIGANIMEELINELEKKQSEIYTDIEDLIGTEEFANGYEEGYLNAFDLAIMIVKERLHN